MVCATELKANLSFEFELAGAVTTRLARLPVRSGQNYFG